MHLSIVSFSANFTPCISQSTPILTFKSKLEAYAEVYKTFPLKGSLLYGTAIYTEGTFTT